MQDQVTTRRARRTEHRKIGGLPVALCDESEMVEMMVADIGALRRGALPAPVTVLSANGHSLSLHAENRDFARAMEAADMIHADGQSIVILSRLLPGPTIRGRSATTDFIHAAARAAVRAQASFYLLGAEDGINRAGREALERLYPGLGIAGARDGYFGPEEEAGIVEAINRSGAEVLWVGMGKPREQLFIHRNRDRLRCAWIVSCGGCFDFLAGNYRRAPLWVQRSGLEWVHRAATGPRYLIGRYLKTNLHTLWLGMRHARDV